MSSLPPAPKPHLKPTIYTAPVIIGKGRGKFLGYPTFNLEIPHTFPIKQGIYACRLALHSSANPQNSPTTDPHFIGALHFGPTPTFNDSTPSLEIFVLDYDSDAPIHTISFGHLHYLRQIKQFNSESTLTAQITQDVINTRRHFRQDNSNS